MTESIRTILFVFFLPQRSIQATIDKNQHNCDYSGSKYFDQFWAQLVYLLTVMKINLTLVSNINTISILLAFISFSEQTSIHPSIFIMSCLYKAFPMATQD